MEKTLVQKAVPKGPEWPSYDNLGKVTQNPHFLKKFKERTKRNFSKIVQKVALVWKAQKHSGANGIILYLACTKSGKTRHIRRLQKCPNGQVMATFARSPKTRIFWKSAKGGQREIFKKSPKRYPRLKGPKNLWRKWFYPLSMHLNCKDRRWFWRKQRHQKCPNNQVMAILAKSPQTSNF